MTFSYIANIVLNYIREFGRGSEQCVTHGGEVCYPGLSCYCYASDFSGTSRTVRFWATVCKTVRPMLGLSVRCLSCLSCRPTVCLSVTFVHCGQTVGRIKMKLGMQVGFSPGHIVLGGDTG